MAAPKYSVGIDGISLQDVHEQRCCHVDMHVNVSQQSGASDEVDADLRLGFGADIERIIPQCSFPLAFGPDVFHVALEKRAAVVIEDAQADNIIQRIPQWHRQVISAKSFLLLPVVLQNEVVGLIYADSDRVEGNKINAELFNLLRTLRSQVVLAFKHSGASGRR
jgi:GAF domain-containing protein